MSKRNTWENKQSARERLKAERVQQAKKDKLRRQLVVGGAVVAVIAIAAGIGVAVSNMSGDDESGGGKVWSAAAKKKLVAPANTSGKDGLSIVIGDKKAEHTLDVYEDPRCPACAQFEQTTGDVLLKDIKDGKYKASFTIAGFIDKVLTPKGNGSKNGTSALGAALNVGKQEFLDYKTALYSVKNHPAETSDTFADDAELIKIAQQVEGLKGNKTFEKAVKNGTYDKWALEMNKQFDKSGMQGTPSFKLDGKKLQKDAKGTAPSTPEEFNSLVDKEIAAK
ncbi:thioredoxin domain-containing protein [Streptomyces sp. H27-D2]|uniref:thioredoxin domain-containing protein n=1 Tax=Streptomyces sp. H27-D2 TaxID=3046304 RepID=UPI002DB624ED|nr:thioredoxin domain-containing protein [Streptomyces sp. H27-D2]MEC4017932.1 thioredoxin domain-containing protein [Streptomyces sp. H27-D2]